MIYFLLARRLAIAEAIGVALNLTGSEPLCVHCKHNGCYCHQRYECATQGCAEE